MRVPSLREGTIAPMRVRWFSAAAISALSVLIGHEVAYRAAAWPAQPSHLLHATGHGWLGLAPAVLAASATLLLLRVVSVRSPASYRAVPYVATVTFLLVEVAERLAHTGRLTASMGWSAVAIGLVVVHLLARLAAFLMAEVERFVVDRPTASFRWHGTTAPLGWCRETPSIPASPGSAWLPRGPPLMCMAYVR